MTRTAATAHGTDRTSRPKAMTVPLMLLAAGAVLAGFVGIPAALCGDNAIEHFLRAELHGARRAVVAGHGVGDSHATPAPVAATATPARGAPARREPQAAATAPRRRARTGRTRSSWADGLLGAARGPRHLGRAAPLRARARRSPNALARRGSPGRTACCSNKYYVDEFYDATVGARHDGGRRRARWPFDRTVVDGAVNGSGWLTRFLGLAVGRASTSTSSTALVNLVGSVLSEASFGFRRLQTGLIQNYALLMMVGVFALRQRLPAVALTSDFRLRTCAVTKPICPCSPRSCSRRLPGRWCCCASPARQETAIKWLANLVALAGFVVSLPLWFELRPPGPGVPVRRSARRGSRPSAPSTSSASTASARCWSC